jgi:hypothetical protein
VKKHEIAKQQTGARCFLEKDTNKDEVLNKLMPKILLKPKSG